MQTSTFKFSIVLFLLLFSSILLAQQAAPSLTDDQVNARVESIIKQMNLHEKVGQLNQLGAADWNIKADPVSPEEHARRCDAGSFLWTTDSKLMDKLQHIAMTECRAKIPLLFGFDVIHGYRNMFPIPVAMAASWDPAMVEKAQTIAALEASSTGLNWDFTPMVDIARDPRWGRIVEGAGEDPYLGAAMARAQVLGLQGPQLGTPGHMLASVKHFAGYGAADGGRDYDASYIPEELFRNVYLVPFHAAIKAGAGTVMSAYMDLNDVPASGNRWLLRDILRRDLGFKGFVISDADAVKSLQVHGYARDPKDAAYKGLTAGVNMDMSSKTYLNNLEDLVKAGKLIEADIDEAVRPILAIKVRMGLFENPYVDLSKSEKILSDPEHRQYTRTAAQRSIVLLRNENHTLPLQKNLKSVAVIGPLADAPKDLTGSWDVENASSVGPSILQAIRSKLPNTKVTYAVGGEMKRKFPMPWGDQSREEAKPMTPEQLTAEVNKAVAASKASDMTILVLGENANMSGEASSRSTLVLPGNQQQLLEAVAASGKPVVMVLVNGRPLDITWAAEHVPAIVEGWYGGTEAANAITDVLFGDLNPGGKLPFSWPRGSGQVPTYYAHNLTQIPETAPDFKSRYWDILSTPLYPFGYGLSYTDFAFSNLRVSNEHPKVGETFKVTADVQNTGKVAGDEVVQLYIHQQAGSASRPVRQLKGFERVSLAPGETKTVRFNLGPDELSYWSGQSKSWIEEPEQFDVWVGGDSNAPLHSTFHVEAQ
ncbi:MAG: beta-glucosidase BglX [Terriglobales bacterium]